MGCGRFNILIVGDIITLYFQMNNELFTDTDQKYFSVVRNPSLVP